MVFLIPILLCLLFSIQYDQREGTCALGEYSKSKRKFIFIFAWLVFISAFQYCVGYDIPIYMNAYEINRNNGFSDIWGDARYRPGWLLVQYLCHKISDDFVVLKMVQAIFLNFCIYKFLLRYSKYWYLTLFFYILYPYGQLNFGAMRQAFAVGFFLLSIPYLEEQDSKRKTVIALLKYSVLVYFATLFHVSAFFLYLVPLLKFCVATTKRMTTTITTVIVVSIIISQFSGLNMLLYSLIKTSDMLEQNSNYYLTGGDYVSNKSGFGLILAYVPIALVYICLYLNRNKKDTKYKVLQMLLLAYIIMATLNLSIPIFYRFNDYFVFAYIIFMPMAIYEGNLFNRPLIAHSPFLKVALFLMFILYPVNHLISIHPSWGIPGYRIYYPYHSVFNPQIDPDRNRIINFNL